MDRWSRSRDLASSTAIYNHTGPSSKQYDLGAAQAAHLRPSDLDQPWSEANGTPSETSAAIDDSTNNSLSSHQPSSPMLERARSKRDTDIDFGIDQEIHMSITAQARELGLCYDYRVEHPFASKCIPTPPRTISDDLADPAGATNIGILTTLSALGDSDTHDKWEVNKESAAFLASVITLGASDEPGSLFEGSETDRKQLKMEEPLLRCDHELDMRRLKQGHTVRINTRGLQPFALNEKDGESLHWSLQQLALPSQVDREISDEKLNIDQETMQYIHGVAAVPVLDEWEVIAEILDSDRATRLRSITPPLIPLEQPHSPPVLPSPLAEFELTSTPEDPNARKADELYEEIMRADETPMSHTMKDQAPATNTFDFEEIDDGFKTPDLPSSSTSTRGKRLRDLKLESPLTPHDSLDPLAKRTKTVSFPSEMRTLAPLPDSDISVTDPYVNGQRVDDFINEFIAPVAELAVQQTEGEQLSEADTILRVEVPRLDEQPPEAPWRQFMVFDKRQQLAAQRTLLAFTKRELLADESVWKGVSKVERMLPWSPFPARLADVQLDEDLDDDGSAVKYLATLAFEDNVDLEDLVCKAGGLQLLDDHDSDYDELETVNLEREDEHDGVPKLTSALPSPPVHQMLQVELPGTHNTPNVSSTRLDMQTLLRKRKLELEADAQRAPSTINGVPADPNASGPEHSRKMAKIAAQAERGSGLTAGDGIFSFMRLQGIRAKTPRHSTQQLSTLVPPPAPAAAMVQSPGVSAHQPKVARSIPEPHIGAVEGGIQIVVTPAILANRSMIRRLQTILPGLDLIERDLLRKATTSVKANLRRGAAEADITVSPGVGVLITTLQKSKQKPLPGQASFYGIRERMADVSLSYERLLIFVSEGCSETAELNADMQALDERDCEALADLMAYATRLDAEIDVAFVPGGEEQLVKWVAAAISRRAIQSDDLRLIADETLWERFLREARMNAFAAQCVLCQLKAPEAMASSETSITTVQSKDPELYGLAGFLHMSGEQRLHIFGPMLGGQRVLSRVNKAVDSMWASR